jgi:Tol biopolymer transport system component
VKTRFSELEGVFSPDGRWVAYESDETGRMEIYVQAYPGPGARTRVSIEGGVGPAWNARGGELFYQSQTAVMAQRIENGRPVGPPTQLFAHASRQPRTRDWDVNSDGQRFLVVERAEAGSSASQINIVANWFEELKRRVPSGKK